MRIACFPVLSGLLLVASCSHASSEPYAGFVDAPTAAVAAQQTGRVERISVHEGDEVHRGQLLAQLDSRTQAASVQEAQANVDVATEALAEAAQNLAATLPTATGAAADIARAGAALKEARLEYDRTEHLVHERSLSQSNLDAARAQLDEARATLDGMIASRAATHGHIGAAGAAVANARATVKSRQAALAFAQAQLDEMGVLSPFDGIIVERDLEEGEWAAPGTPVVTIEDLSHPWVRLDVSETEIARWPIGRPTTIELVAMPGKRLHGHVAQVGAEGDFAVNRDVKRGRPDLRTFRVRVAIDAPPSDLRPGMTAEVRPEPRAPEGVAGKSQAAR